MTGLCLRRLLTFLRKTKPTSNSPVANDTRKNGLEPVFARLPNAEVEPVEPFDPGGLVIPGLVVSLGAIGAVAKPTGSKISPLTTPS